MSSTAVSKKRGRSLSEHSELSDGGGNSRKSSRRSLFMKPAGM